MNFNLTTGTKEVIETPQKIVSSDNTRADAVIPAHQFPKVKINPLTQMATVLGSRENLEYLLNYHGITCRYNLISREDEIVVPGLRTTSDNRLNSSINEVLNLCINNGLPNTHVLGHLKQIADMNAYNPVLDWINSSEWDGVDRLTQVIDGVKVKKGFEEIKRLYLEKWFLCAVGMLYNGRDDGQGGEFSLEYEGILVFQSTQGTGKTTWFKNLVTPSMNYLIKDAFELVLKDKDNRITFSSHWLVELGELEATFRKSDIDSVKSFITAPKDRLRRPFDRVDTTMHRRTSIFASVNETQFLQDETGNRRFWCLALDGKIETPKNFNPQQFWAQIHHLLNEKGGAGARPWFITGEDAELRDRASRSFLVTNPHEDMIKNCFNVNEEAEFKASVTSIAKYIGANTAKRDTNDVSKVLQRLGFKRRTSDSKYMMPRPHRGDSVFKDAFTDDLYLHRVGFEKIKK